MLKCLKKKMFRSTCAQKKKMNGQLMHCKVDVG